MKIRTQTLTAAAAAAFALGAFALPGAASALTWDQAIAPKASVTGTSQSVDRTADWAKQVTAMSQLSGMTRAGTGPLGFFEEAKNLRGYASGGQVATR